MAFWSRLKGFKSAFESIGRKAQAEPAAGEGHAGKSGASHLLFLWFLLVCQALTFAGQWPWHRSGTWESMRKVLGQAAKGPGARGLPSLHGPAPRLLLAWLIEQGTPRQGTEHPGQMRFLILLGGRNQRIRPHSDEPKATPKENQGVNLN